MRLNAAIFLILAACAPPGEQVSNASATQETVIVITGALIPLPGIWEKECPPTGTNCRYSPPGMSDSVAVGAFRLLGRTPQARLEEYDNFYLNAETGNFIARMRNAGYLIGTDQIVRVGRIQNEFSIPGSPFSSEATGGMEVWKSANAISRGKPDGFSETVYFLTRVFVPNGASVAVALTFVTSSLDEAELKIQGRFMEITQTVISAIARGTFIRTPASPALRLVPLGPSHQRAAFLFLLLTAFIACRLCSRYYFDKQSYFCD